MNPLDLRGPQFLTFYLFYGAVVFVVAYWLYRKIEEADAPGVAGGRWAPGRYPGEDDAYPIAFLRGGRQEVAKTVLARLVTSGALRLEGDSLLPGAAGATLTGIEASAMAVVGPGIRAQAAPAAVAQAIALDLAMLEEEMRREGLLTSHETRRRFRLLCLAALLALPGLGLLKLWVALGRGRTNVGFLLLLIALFAIVLLATLKPPAIRAKGKRYLRWVEDACRDMGSRLRTLDPAAPTFAAEAALAAGIFGLAGVPTLTDLDGRLRHRAASREYGSGCGSVYSGGDGGGDGGGGGSDGGGGGGGASGCGGCGGGGD